MNYSKKYNYTTLLVLLVSSILWSCTPAGHTAVRNTEITAAIDSNRWTFTAQQVRPQVGNNGPINGLYTVDYIPGTLAVYLPYFGRAFGNADLLNSKGPLDFTTTDFTVEKTEVKKGRWEINFQPKDQREIRNFLFTVFANGSANLNVTLSNRSPISYSGNLVPYRKK